jgi:conflict system STAND superfamily ATPase/SIR2-like protein
MIPRVKNLAAQMRMKKEQGEEKFVLLLGAGASISSGVPPTSTIMAELLKQYDNENTGGDTAQRFDQLWNRTPNTMRRGFLQPYLKLPNPPSTGYEKLAELIRAGYFDLALTFNFDDLLETSLKNIGFAGVDDIKSLIRGETIPETMQTLVDAPEPRFKLLKLHGSLNSADYFLFDAAEMHKYPEPIEALFKHVTKRDIIVCGYAFNDNCVTQAFAARGGSVVCVNPSGVPRNLSVFLKDRKSEDIDIKADFDTFFSELHHELLESEQVDTEKPPPNPFKFLESYDEADKVSFRGRDDSVEYFFKFLEWNPAPRVIVIAGPNKAGKTSLVRAGLLSRLDPNEYLGVYLRCRKDLESHIPSDLARMGMARDDDDLPAALKHLGTSSPGKRVILFLDQFERVTCRFILETKTKKKELSDFLAAQLFAGSNDNLTLVLVVTDDGSLGGTLSQECNKNQLSTGTIVCQSFDRDEVVGIMQSLATTAGFDFDKRIIEEMADSFEQTRNSPSPARRFTLAHIHAICHILAATRRVSYESYKTVFDQQNLEALHQAINVSEFTSFAEDFAWPNSAWFRNMIKVPLRESKDRIARFIQEHYEELLPRDDPRTGGRKGQLTGSQLTGSQLTGIQLTGGHSTSGELTGRGAGT